MKQNLWPWILIMIIIASALALITYGAILLEGNL